MRGSLKGRLILYASTFAMLFALWRGNIEYQLVASTKPTAWTEDIKADCAVVVTGGPGRIREGLDLLYKGDAKKLIISGVNPRANWRDIMPTWAFYGETRDEDVILEKRSTTTYGNAIQSLPLVEALHCRSVALVTSTLHMHRALHTFRGVYPESIPIFPHAIVGGRLDPDWTGVMSETIKSLFYSLWAY